MKFLILSFSLIFTFNGFSQKIERKSVPGTRLSVEIHGSSELAKHAPILTIDDEVDLNIVEMSDSAAYERAKVDMTIENIQAQGFTIKENRPIQINDCAGQLYLVEVGESQYGFSCYFGDASFLAICTAVYERSDEVMLSKLLKAVQSIELVKNQPIDWNSFLSFNYDNESIFQLDSNQNHNLGIRFTVNGISQKSLYDRTMIMCMQTEPSFQTQSAQDVINVSLVPQLALLEISDVMIDGQDPVEGTDSYVFNAMCNTDDTAFEIYCRAFYHETAVVLVTAYITENENDVLVKEFIDGIRLKKDGF